MTADNRKKELLEKRAYPPYQGDEPYVYLSFAPWEVREGLLTRNILNEAGCHVSYDDKMLTGRPWTSGICDVIESCFVFFEIHSPEFHFSLEKKLASEFANRLDKRKINAYLQPPDPEIS